VYLSSGEAVLTGEEHTSSYTNSDEKPFIGVGNILDWLTSLKHIPHRRREPVKAIPSENPISFYYPG
jgi:hypothetical protein